MDLVSTTISDDEKSMLKSELIGGVILFKRNFESSKQLKALTKDIRKVAARDILIAVDQEGGRVQRFKTDKFTRFPPMKELTTKKVPLNKVEDMAWLLATECMEHGIDISFAPVLDIDNGADVVGDRAFSSDVEQTIEYVSAWCNGFKSAGMASIGKHFPGHGSTKADTHEFQALDDRSYQEVMSQDGKVFVEMINKKALEGLMPAHIHFTSIADSPVGYSPVWLQNILREKLRFDGVIFSDDLSMVGAGQGLSYAEKVELALNAGCDMVLVCNNSSAVANLIEHFNGNWSDESSKALRLVAEHQVTYNQNKKQRIIKFINSTWV